MAGTSDGARVLQQAAAAFLSDLKSKFRTSQKAVDFVVNEVDHLNQIYLSFLKEVLVKKCALQDGHLHLEKIFSELDACRGQSLFEGVHSQPYLDSYISHQSATNPFGLTQVVLDTVVVFRKGVPVEVPKDYAYFPPFLPQLEQLLNCKDVLHCVDNPRPVVDGVFKTVTDGYFYRFHYIVKRHGNTVLAIEIHVDDVEFADPCKSKTKKHKLRLFYWCLGNIYPELRSALKAINLLGIVRYEVAKKYGNEAILKHFVKDLQDLGADEGVKMVVMGEVRTVHAVLQMGNADIPAAANLGGMKESHFALRPCRICMATRFELCNYFKEDETLLRKLEEHNRYVAEIEAKKPYKKTVVVNVNLNGDVEPDVNLEDFDPDGDLIQDEGPKFNDHPDPSINYGINKRSVLADAPGFDVTKCLPFDIMHVLFEGVVELLCRLMLKEMCTKPNQPEESTQLRPLPKRRKKEPQEKPKLTLKYVNKIIQESCDFGHLNVSKPSPIENSHLKSKLKQSASQMIVLVHVLPFIASNNIGEEKLELLEQLIRIVSLAMKFEITMEDVQNLERTVETFGENFVKIYPCHKTLKLHSLKHLKMQILLHGPLRQQACFRYEAMHRDFTRLVDVINNMKNIEFSMASRHLSARNNDIMCGKTDGTFLYPGDTVKKTEMVKLSTLPEKDLLLGLFPELSEDTDVDTVVTFLRNGRSWHKDVVFSHPETEAPEFGIISKIYVINGEMVFMFNNLKVHFIQKFHAFEIRRREKTLRCIRFSDIKFQFPVARFTFHLGTNKIHSYLVSGSSGDIVA